MEYWEQNAKRYDRAISVLNNRFMQEIGHIVESHIQDSDRVLEVAAGTGLITQHLLHAQSVTVTDLSNEMLEIASSRVRARLKEVPGSLVFEKADVLSLPYSDNSFDVVVAGNVLHLVAQPHGALSEIKRVLKSGGLVILPTFCHGQNLKTRFVSLLLQASGFPIVTRFTSTSAATQISSHFQSIFQTTIGGVLPVFVIIGKKQI